MEIPLVDSDQILLTKSHYLQVNSSKINANSRLRDNHRFKDEEGELVSSLEVLSVCQQWSEKRRICVSTTQAVNKELLPSELSITFIWISHSSKITFPQGRGITKLNSIPSSYIFVICKHCACHSAPRRFP